MNDDTLSPDDEVRRRWLIRALAGGLIGGPLTNGRALAADPFGGRPAKLAPGQSIYRISGRVLVNGSAAAADTRIAATDTIETAPGAELVFAVGASAMLMRADSRVVLEGGAANLSGFKLIQGRLLSVFAPGAKRLTTPTASIGVTGTGVYLTADPEQTYFCTCYGTSEVVAAKDPSSRDTVKSTRHDKPLYIVAAAQPGGHIRAAPFIDHTDQELMLIETLVGRTPPFNFPGSQYKAPRPAGGYGR